MELLLQWIDSLGIDAPATGVESVFSNGFMFGKLLHATNQLTDSEWGQFVNDDKSDSKIRNYCLLFPKMRQLGIKFDAQVAQAVMRRTSGVAPRMLYELQSAIRPLATARVGRSRPGQQRLLRPAARSHKPGYESKQAEIFERNLRVMAENQNDVLLKEHMARQASNVSSLQAARDEAHASRLAAHRQRLTNKRAERLHMLRTRHMVTHAREEAGIREWQRNQEIRLAQTLAKRAFQEKTTARRAHRQDAQRRSAREEAHEGIAEFEALAAEQGVQPSGAAPVPPQELASTIAAQQAALQDAADGPREDSRDPTERRDALHMRLSRKLAATKEAPLAARPAGGRASSMHHALELRAHRRRAFAMHSRDSRLQLHAAQRHEGVTSLLAWRCEAELELDDVVARILKHEVIFRENRAARSQQVEAQRLRDTQLEAERQRMAVRQHRQQFAADLAEACADMEAAADARGSVRHQRAMDVARSAVLKVVDAAVAIAEARELAGMRLTQVGAVAHTCSTALPQLSVAGSAPAVLDGEGGGEGKEGEGGLSLGRAEALIDPNGGADAVSWLQARVAYVHNGTLQPSIDAAAPVSLALADVAPAADGSAEASDGKKPKKGKKGDEAAEDAIAVAAAAAQARALQHLLLQLQGDTAALGPTQAVPEDGHAEQHEGEEDSTVLCGVQLPPGACVALMGAVGDEPGAPSLGSDAAAAAALGHPAGASASLSFFHGSAADARAELEDHEEWGEGEEAAHRRICARSQGRETLSAMRSPSAATAGHAVTLGQTVLYEAHGNTATAADDVAAAVDGKTGADADSGAGAVEAVTASGPAAAQGSKAATPDASISLHLFETYLQRAAIWGQDAPRGQVHVDHSQFEAALAPLLAQYPPLQEADDDAAAAKKSPKSKSKADKGAVDIQLPPAQAHGVLAAHSALEASAQVLADVVAHLTAAVRPPATPPAVCDVPQFPLTMALLGPPGSGVTTHSRFLAAAFDLRLIQPRALITQALALADQRLPLEHCTLPQPHASVLQVVGQRARDALRAGQAVPDVLVVQAIVTAVRALGGAAADPTLAPHVDDGITEQGVDEEASGSAAEVPACRGWILDGFPGTVAQACLLEEALTWHIPQLAAGQQPAEIIPGQGQWAALRGEADVPTGSSPAAGALEALVAGSRVPHPVLDADADEEAAAPTNVDDPRCSSDATPPVPRHAHGVKLVLTLGMSREAALRRVLGLRVDGQRLVTMAAVDDEVPVGQVNLQEGKVAELGSATVTGDAVYGLEVVDSTVKAGARGLNAAAASRGAGGLSVRVARSTLDAAEDGGASVAVAPREPTASGAFVSSAQQGGSATLTGPSVPALPLSGSIAAVDDVGPEGDAAAVRESKQDSSVLEDGVMQVSPAALLPVMSDGYVVRGKSGNVVYHLDSNPPAHKCKTVVRMCPPWAVPLHGRAQLNANLAEGTPVLQPAQLALVMERFWSTQGQVAAFYDAGGRGRFACVSAYKPCTGQDSDGVLAVSGADGSIMFESASWDEYHALGAWAAGQADALNEAELFAVLKRATGHFAEAIQHDESSRAAAWAAVKARRAVALAAHAERTAAQLKHRRGEDVHDAVVSALEAAAAAAVAEAEAAAEAKKSKGAKGKGEAGESKEGAEEPPAAAETEQPAEQAHTPPAGAEEGKEAEQPAELDAVLKYVLALPMSAHFQASSTTAEQAAQPGAKASSGGVKFAASVSFSEGKAAEEVEAEEDDEVDEATQLAAQAASIVVVPTRHADPSKAELGVPQSLTALHNLWQQCVQHYGSNSQDALRAISMEQRGVHNRLGAVQRFLLRFLRRPVPQYAALMAHAQAEINSASWEERMGPTATQASLTPADALLEQRVQAALESEVSASKKPAGRGDKTAEEPAQLTAEETAQAAANTAAARRAELAEVVELAACGMLAVASARRDAALQYIDARKRDAWAAHVKSALAAHLCELLQCEADRLVGERLVLLGYFRALDGADGLGIWTGHNAHEEAAPSAEDSLGAKSLKGKDKKGKSSKDADGEAMPDASELMLELQRLLEGRALHAAAVAAPLQAAGATHPALPLARDADERPGSSLKQKRSKSPKSGKDAEDDTAAWPVNDAHAPRVCLLAPPVSPCVAVVPVAAPSDVLPALRKVPAVQSILPDDADAMWRPVRDAAAAADESEGASAPTSARGSTPKGKSRQGSRNAPEEPSADGVLQLPLGWAAAPAEECDWDEVQGAAADAMHAVQGVLQSAVHGVGVHVGVADELSQELLRVMDACCASAARAALAATAARHRAAQEAALEEAVAAAADSKGKKGKGGKGKKSKGGSSKDKKGKKGDVLPTDPADAAVQWKVATCPVQDDSGLCAVQDAIAVCERLGASVLQLVHAAAETQEIQRQRHAAEAVARERRRRRLLGEAAIAAEAAAAEAAAEAEAAAAAAAAESLGSKKAGKGKPKEKSKDKKGAKDKKGGKGGLEAEESHLPAADVTHTTVDPAVWSAIVHRVQLFRSRCQYIGELATQLLASVDAAAERSWVACAAAVDAVLQQEVQAIGGFRATALRAVATGARLPYKLCFTRPHAALDLDLLPAALSAAGGAEHAIGMAASALAHGESIVPASLYVPALSGAVVAGLHQYQLPCASEMGNMLPHAFPQSIEESVSAAQLTAEQTDAEGKEADAAEGATGFQLLAPTDALITSHAPPCNAPDVPLHEKLQDFFKLHFQVDVTQRVLPPPTADPRPPLLLEDATDDAALRPRPSQLYAFALRLRKASLQGKFGGAFHARAYSVAKADLWPSPPPMESEATQLTDGASEDGEDEEAASSSLSSVKGGKEKSLKSKDKKGGKDKAAEEEGAAIAAAARSAQAAVLAAEQALQGEELVPPGTFLGVQEFVQAVREAVVADELPAGWTDVPDSTLAAVALCFVSDLSEWAPWEVRVEQEPLSSVSARKAYAAWQLQEVERLLAEEASAQARADAEEAQRLGVTAAEVAEMREAAERGEEPSLVHAGDEQHGDALLDGQRAGSSAGSRSGASTPRSMASEASVVADVVDAEGSQALGSPLDVQQLTALQTASIIEMESKTEGDAADEEEGKDGEQGGDVHAQEGVQGGAMLHSVQAVEPMQAEGDAPQGGTVQLPPSAPSSGSVTPDDTLRNFSRLCPGPASWPWQEPSTITPRRRVVLHHPLLHHQVPLRIAPSEWEGLVKKWGGSDATKLASAQPTTAHHRSLAQALQAALADAQASAQAEGGDAETAAEAGAGTDGASSPLLSGGTTTPMGDFGQVAWPPVVQDLTTSGFVSGVQPVVVAGLGSVWIDFDASYTAMSADGEDDEQSLVEAPSTAAFEADIASKGAAPQLSLRSSASLESAQQPPLELRTRQAVQQATADALRQLYPPANFPRLVDWRGVVAWLSITGPSPVSTGFLEATLSAVHAESKESSSADIVPLTAAGDGNGAAGSANGPAVQPALWSAGVQGGRDYIIQDITGFSTLVGKGWGVATWPRHEQLDELAAVCESIAQRQLAVAGSADDSAAQGAAAEEEGKGAEQTESSLSVSTTPPAAAPAVPLREGQVFVVQQQLTPHAATPLQAEPVEAEEEQGTPRSRKAKSKKAGGKGGKKGSSAEDEAPVLLQLRAPRQWVDPLADMGTEGAVAEQVLLPEATHDPPLWFERQGLHNKSQTDALRDIGAAAAAQGSDCGAAAATAEAEVDALIGIVSAQRSAANEETGGAVGWHHVSGDHSSREALLLADLSARAQALRELQEAETQRYTLLADRDVQASVDHGDRIMRGVLLQALSDVYGRLDFGRLLRHWRRHVLLQEQLMREEAEEGMRGRASRQSSSDSVSDAPAAAPAVRFCAAPQSQTELEAEAAADAEDAALPRAGEELGREMLMDVYSVLQRAAEEQRQAAADAAAQDSAAQDAARMMEQQDSEAETDEAKEHEEEEQEEGKDADHVSREETKQ